MPLKKYNTSSVLVTTINNNTTTTTTTTSSSNAKTPSKANENYENQTNKQANQISTPKSPSSIIRNNLTTSSSSSSNSSALATGISNTPVTNQQNYLSNHLYSLSDLLPNIIEAAVNCSASASATGHSASGHLNNSTNVVTNTANQNITNASSNLNYCSSSNLNTSSSSSASSSSKSQEQFTNNNGFNGNNNKLPNEIKSRLYEIFSQIEREFDSLYSENIRLKQQLNLYDNSNNNNTTKTKSNNINDILSNNTLENDMIHSNCLENGATTTNTTNFKNTNTSINTNSSSTSTLVSTNPLSPKNLTTTNNSSIINKETTKNNSNQLSSVNNNSSMLVQSILLPSTSNNNTISTNQSTSLTSSLTSSAIITAAATATSSTSKSSQPAAKNRINNLSFPKFKPNAREFIMQSIKNTSAQIVNKTQNHNSLLNCKPQTALNGHKDGIWDIMCLPIPNYLFKNINNNYNNNQNLLIGTASADTTARLWFYNMHSLNQNYSPSTHQSLSPQIHHNNHNQQNQVLSNAICIQEYSGHTGSVNSIRFHPKFFTSSTNLILTSSGDSQAHIWQCVLPQHSDGLESGIDLNFNYNSCYTYAVNSINSTANSNGTNFSCISSPTSTQSPSMANNVNNNYVQDLFSNPAVIRSPIKRYQGHQDACIAAEWFPDGEFLVTASWDRTANVYNVETGKTLCNLQHDDYLTNVTIHKTHKIILTSSKDTTFKIWDFRDPICSVQIYQGHNRSVNSAIFIGDDKIATSSDDHTVKIWDLRIMRSPVCTINLNSGVNRICTMSMSYDSSVSNETYLCLPLDNRDIKIYNLQGDRIIRLPRNNRVGHRRLVTSLASYNNILFSASFDKIVNSWSFDYNPSKSSVNSKSSSNSNKENNEAINNNNNNNLIQDQGHQQQPNINGNKTTDKLQTSSTSPSILTQLSNLTSPNLSQNHQQLQQQPPLAHKIINNSTSSTSSKGVNTNSTKLEKIKI